MTTSQQVLLLAALGVMQAIAMGLPYWIGFQAGRASKALLLEQIQLLKFELKEANGQMLALHARLRVCVPGDNGGNHA